MDSNLYNQSYNSDDSSDSSDKDESEMPSSLPAHEIGGDSDTRNEDYSPPEMLMTMCSPAADIDPPSPEDVETFHSIVQTIARLWVALRQAEANPLDDEAYREQQVTQDKLTNLFRNIEALHPTSRAALELFRDVAIAERSLYTLETADTGDLALPHVDDHPPLPSKYPDAIRAIACFRFAHGQTLLNPTDDYWCNHLETLQCVLHEQFQNAGSLGGDLAWAFHLYKAILSEEESLTKSRRKTPVSTGTDSAVPKCGL